MRRPHMLLTLVTLGCGLIAFFLGTASRPAPSHASATVQAPTFSAVRTTTRAAPARVRAGPVGTVAMRAVHHEQVIRLTRDLRNAVAHYPMLDASWDAERIWPLPDELPDDPVLLALQESFIASETEHEAMLDTLDDALATAPRAEHPWTRLAHLEAERRLYRAEHEASLAQHTDQLAAWMDGGGHSTMPPAPDAWSGIELGIDAHLLAQEADAVGEDPMVADLARLTAASLWLDQTTDVEYERRAQALLLEVVEDADDPAVLAGAVNLLVGTHTALPEGDLDELMALLPELPADAAVRLAWFTSDRWLQAGDAHAAVQAMDAGIDAGLATDSPAITALLDDIFQSRATVLDHLQGAPGPTAPDTISTMAWHCWTQLQARDDPWVLDGTDYAGALHVGPDGVRWSEWTDQNPHQECMTALIDRVEAPDSPAVIDVTFLLPAGR